MIRMNGYDPDLSRRAFLGGALASLGGLALPGDLFAAEERPLLLLGVLSDIHIGGRPQAPQYLESTLRWLEARGVEAVLSPGDIAHSGLIREMRQFVGIWRKVFPDDRARDGRKVALMISAGNHDFDAHWVKGTEAWRAQNVLFHGDNPQRLWPELFGRPYAPVWRGEAKGISFVGSHWRTAKPDIEGYMAKNAATFDPARPFFYCQHEHPKDTCHMGYAGGAYDMGQSVRALSPFPNAVAFSGHSHCSIVDERAVWQGAFTSIGAGCLHEGGLTFAHVNGSAFWHPSYKKAFMRPMNDPLGWGGDSEGGCFLFIEVYRDRLVVHRRSSKYDLPIGPDWIVPLPARTNGPFDFAARAKARQAPAFAADAAVVAKACPQGHEEEGIAHRGEPCVAVSFPAARPVGGCRVFDYVVTAKAEGKVLATQLLFAPGGVLPEAKQDRPAVCLFPLAGLPTGKEIAFSVVPRECFGRQGRAIEGTLAL